uniref:Uncharacterized protein n=1 Tax=Arcella intermedia TaxID=1963864 RepID=A0A6B2LU15_9EUKA
MMTLKCTNNPIVTAATITNTIITMMATFFLQDIFSSSVSSISFTATSTFSSACPTFVSTTSNFSPCSVIIVPVICITSCSALASSARCSSSSLVSLMMAS